MPVLNNFGGKIVSIKCSTWALTVFGGQANRAPLSDDKSTFDEGSKWSSLGGMCQSNICMGPKLPSRLLS